jgi:hypothetical protein
VFWYLEIILGLEHGGVDGPNSPTHEHYASVAELEEHIVRLFKNNADRATKQQKKGKQNMNRQECTWIPKPT